MERSALQVLYHFWLYSANARFFATQRAKFYINKSARDRIVFGMMHLYPNIIFVYVVESVPKLKSSFSQNNFVQPLGSRVLFNFQNYFRVILRRNYRKMLKYILLHFSKTRLLKLHQSAVGCTVYCKGKKMQLEMQHCRLLLWNKCAHI